MNSYQEYFDKMQTFALKVMPKSADLVHKAKVQREISQESRRFAVLYPLASYFVFVMALSIPDIFYCISLGVPFIRVALTLDKFIASLVVWYLTFFCPRDIFYTITKDKFVRTIIGVLCEVNRRNCFMKLSDKALKAVPKSYFTALLIPTFYGCAFSLFIYPLDQLIRGSVVHDHEAKSPHFASMVVFMYSITTGVFLFLRDLEYPFLKILNDVSLDTLHMSVMVVAIVLSIFKDLVGFDPISSQITNFMNNLKSAPSKPSRKKVEQSTLSVEDGDVDVVEVQKKTRTTRKRQSSKL